LVSTGLCDSEGEAEGAEGVGNVFRSAEEVESGVLLGSDKLGAGGLPELEIAVPVIEGEEEGELEAMDA